MKVEVVHCQGCGAILPFDGNQSNITCSYCGIRNTISDKPSNEVAEFLKKARRMSKANHKEDALYYYSRATEINPDNAEIWYEMVELLTDGFQKQVTFINELEDLQKYLNQAIEAGIDKDRLMTALTYIQELQGAFEQEKERRIKMDDKYGKKGEATNFSIIAFHLLDKAIELCSTTETAIVATLGCLDQ